MVNQAFKKVVIAAGGSGGHLYPAMELAKELLSSKLSIEVLFVAGGLSENRFFDKKKFNHYSVSSGTFSKTPLLKNFKSCKDIFGGFFQSRKILARYCPDLVIGFGSHHSLPTLLAARWLKIPTALHEQNSKPGKVIRMFSKNSLMTGIYFPSAQSHIKGKTVQLAMPLRKTCHFEEVSRASACHYFGLDPLKPTLLAFGGSQGARAINLLVSEALGKLYPSCQEWQLLHFTGDETQALEFNDLYEKMHLKCVVKAFEPRMEMAWKAADLVISRSGAGTIAELLEFEVPAILIPYPHAAENHQESNADFMVDIMKGGWKYKQHELNKLDFSAILKTLFKNQLLLKEKRQGLAAYKQQACRLEFSSIILDALEHL